MKSTSPGNRISRSREHAHALLKANELVKAAQIYEQVCKDNPKDIESWVNLVRVYAALNQPARVERCCRSILSVLPNSDDAYYNLGFALMMQKKYSPAIDAFRKTIQLNPSHAIAFLHLGKLLHLHSNLDEALACYRRASRLRSDLAEAYCGIADIHENRGQIADAIEAYRNTLAINPDLLEANIGLGLALCHLGEFEEAIKHAEHALQIAPTNEDAIALTANIANRTGDSDTALRLLQPIVRAGSKHVNIAVAFSACCRDNDCVKEAVATIENILNAGEPLSPASRFSLHFELGKCYDKLEDYDKAFHHYRQGNEIKPAAFDLQRHSREIDAITETFSHDFMARAPRARIRSGRPVFVVGMVRSGTSLVEQIMASHPSIHGAGELPDIIRLAMSLHTLLGSREHYPACTTQLTQDAVERMANEYLDRLHHLSPDASRVVDKMPGNFAHLGLIELLFPDARVIHCKRDPLDTCLSAYFQDFSQSHAYSCDLAQLGAVYRQYSRIMAHWKETLRIPVLDIQYEDLVSDQEGVSRRLIEFCDLDWDDQCLKFHETRRHVATASYDQVRQPLYKRSVGRWKHYEKHLAPLLEALGDI